MFHRFETNIVRINFYHNEQRLVAVGADDMWAMRWGGRREVFNVADDEQLIGCELDQHEYDCGKYNWSGLTWTKMKVLRF